MSVIAVVVHFGDARRTTTLIDSLGSVPIVTRTIVILHDSYAGSRSDRIEWIESDNRGYAAGLNRGVERALSHGADSDLMIALNPDIEIDSERIHRLVAEHLAANADCTFPVLREQNRVIYGYKFSRFGTLKSSTSPDWYSGACFLFSGSAWKRAGGFDESYFHYFEDRDFCLRLKSAGLRCHQAADIVFEHEGKSGADYPETELPMFAVRNHLMALHRSEMLGPVAFLNVSARHLFYLFRWKKGWRGIPKWRKGIQDFVTGSVVKSFHELA